ncbi:MAG TPA: phosphatase PAP2 family protein [Rhizobiaceae bacterium]|nr:phosphatase PAP2 family protein [Rhizobiaceae bacterium]
MPGLVTFPSFHTAAGIVVAWCLRRTLFYWPGVVYSVAMIASTPVFGGHYFIDVIAGAFVAFAVLAMVARFPRYSQLHAIPELPIPQAARPAMSTLRMRP